MNNIKEYTSKCFIKYSFKLKLIFLIKNNNLYASFISYCGNENIIFLSHKVEKTVTICNTYH